MNVKSFACCENFTNCYVVFDEKTCDAFCVDVSDRLSKSYFDFIRRNHLNVKYLFLTHGHYDHTEDILSFKNHFPNAKIVISEADYQNILNRTAVFCPPEAFVTPDITVLGNETFEFCAKPIKVIATPGHTNGCVCFFYNDALFCGDTVFCGSVGRTDLPTGSFIEILQSVNKIKHLPVNLLYPGHMESTDIETELKNNPFFKYETDY